MMLPCEFQNLALRTLKLQKNPACCTSRMKVTTLKPVCHALTNWPEVYKQLGPLLVPLLLTPLHTLYMLVVT